MKMGKATRTLVGAGTLLYILFPILMFATWFFMMFTILITASGPRGSEPSPLAIFPMFCFMPLAFLMIPLQFILIPFYLIHIIKNKSGSELYRILSAIGMVFMPFIAMPFYFFVYIWPDQPAAWAEEAPSPIVPPPAKAGESTP